MLVGCWLDVGTYGIIYRSRKIRIRNIFRVQGAPQVDYKITLTRWGLLIAYQNSFSLLYFILSKFNEIRFGVSISSHIVTRYRSNFISFQIWFIIIITDYPKKGLFDFTVIFGEVSFGVL
jgi:hypothetical protein